MTTGWRKLDDAASAGSFGMQNGICWQTIFMTSAPGVQNSAEARDLRKQHGAIQHMAVVHWYSERAQSDHRAGANLRTVELLGSRINEPQFVYSIVCNEIVAWPVC